MATWPKQALRVSFPSNSFLSYATRKHEEGASQTFVASAPIVLTSGLVVQAASPATAIYGFALKAGQNGTAAANLAEFVVAISGLVIHANFLGSAGADNAIAQGDYGTGFQLELDSDMLGSSSPGWYVEDATGTPSVRMTTNESDVTLLNSSQGNRVLAGDTNARPSFSVLNSVNSYL